MMYRTWIGIGSAAVVGVIIGFGLGSASGQQTPEGLDLQVLGTVDAGENCPGHVLRMRRVTFEPGASIPMHSHKDRPEVYLVTEGTLAIRSRVNPRHSCSRYSRSPMVGSRASTCERDQQTRCGPWRGLD